SPSVFVRSLILIEPDVEIDAVGPPVNVALLTQVALVPCLVITFPAGLESHNVSGRQSAGSLTQDGLQSFRKISGRDPFKVKGWDQSVDAGSPTHVLGQNRTGKTTLVPVPDPWLTNPDRTHST